MADRSAVRWIVGLALVFVLLLGVWISVLVLRFKASARRQTSPAPSPTVGRMARDVSPAPGGDKGSATDRRLWREDHRLDDAARAFILKGVLRKSGNRCDRVVRALMQSPGNWYVECAPGYYYGFMFDERGTLVSALKL